MEWICLRILNLFYVFYLLQKQNNAAEKRHSDSDHLRIVVQKATVHIVAEPLVILRVENEVMPQVVGGLREEVITLFENEQREEAFQLHLQSVEMCWCRW